MTDDPKTEAEAQNQHQNQDHSTAPEASGDQPQGGPTRAIKIGSQRDPAPAPQVEATESVAPEPTPAAEPAADAEQTVAVPFPPPRLQRMSEDLQREIDDALQDISLDELLQGGPRTTNAAGTEIQLDERCQATVIKVDRDLVFFSLDGQHEGMASLRQFPEPPTAGMRLEVIPIRLLTEDNLYELTVPGAAIQVQDWSDLTEGIVVDARITGHNKGGLECDVHRIRGFMPISQVALYRVEDLEPYVGQTLPCVVTEANPDRRNLVLSHRAVLERQQEESREKLLRELEVGQVREGTVRRLQKFGAFVDLGGIDGLVHISQLSWDRISDPSQVLQEGQRIKVRVDKVDTATGRISLSYRDLLEQPWQGADAKFPIGTVLEGTVTKIMDFGAFVRVAPGVEGLVHISELAHQRVVRVNAVVSEGQTVQVKVLSIDPAAQKLSLSIRAVQRAAPEPAEEEDADETPPPPPPQRREPLKGGLSHRSGGDQFGLNW